MSSHHYIERDDPRCDKLIAYLKRTRLYPRQFRLSALFLTTLVLSVVLAAPRWAGETYADGVLFLGFVAFVLAPFFVLVVVASVPWLRLRSGILLTSTVAIAPCLTGMIWLVDFDDVLYALIATALCAWLPQMVCIWGVWYFVFRDVRRRRG